MPIDPKAVTPGLLCNICCCKRRIERRKVNHCNVLDFSQKMLQTHLESNKMDIALECPKFFASNRDNNF